MALNEISFYNTNGDEISLSNIVNQMINYYNMKHEVGETVITDFNEGSEIRNLLEAFAIGIYALLEEQHEATKIAFISTSEGVFLDRLGELPFIDLPRITGSVAGGSVTFTLAEVQSDDVVIPAETFIRNEDEISFYTLSDCVISSGDLTGSVLVEAISPGVDGNAPAGTVTIFEDEDIDTSLVSVTNAEDFRGGSDWEDDDEYRQRLLDNVQADGFGTVGWYRSLCEDVDGVHDVKFVSDATYTRKCLVNGIVKPTPNSVLLDVLTELSDLDNLVLGHRFIVDKPTYTSVNLAISLDVTNEMDTDILDDCLGAFIDGTSFDRMSYTGLRIGEDFNALMVKSALAIFPDVVDVTSVESGGVEVDTVSPGVNGVIQLGTVSWTQNEVS
jgi:hypothetical protein